MVRRERGLKNKKGLKILGAKVRSRLGFLEIEVRGIVFNHNPFNFSSLFYPCSKVLI